jgi:uncharacterized membrane protein YeiH
VPMNITRLADLAGTFVFAVEGALAAIDAGLDPVGVLVLAFFTALGGGIIRDVMIGATPPAAIRDPTYPVIVLAAAAVIWLLQPPEGTIPFWLLIALDAMGLGLFAVAGTEKSLDHGVHPLPAIFLGTVSGAGGGTIRDILLNQVPLLLHADIYALAGMAAAAVVVAGRRLRLPPRLLAVAAILVCCGLRLLAVAYDWQLPKHL